MVSSVQPIQRVQSMPRQRTAPPPGYISVDDAAKLTNVSRSTAFTYSAPGGLWESEGVNIYRPTTRGRWVRRADLIEWNRKRGLADTTK